jgi:cell wall-associated NlpC family hydrolase
VPRAYRGAATYARRTTAAALIVALAGPAPARAAGRVVVPVTVVEAVGVAPLLLVPVQAAVREVPVRASRAQARQEAQPLPEVPAPVPPRATRRAPERSRIPAPVGYGSAAAVVAFALAQVGKSYRKGASGPGAWDCSGLTQAAYARVGVRLPHNADAQRRYGRPVSRGELRPGDLVLWSGHVGIALDSTWMVAAANSREGVVRQRIYGTPTAYRRLIG